MNILCFNQVTLIRLTAFTILLFVSLIQVNANCPSSVCFCTKATATSVCNSPTFKNKCKIEKCKSSTCPSGGFKCTEKVAPTGILSPSAKRVIQAEIRRKGGCKGHVCFAIDGSGSINNQEWGNQLKFVSDVIDIISPFATRVGGTQYSDKSYPIMSLTTNFNAFKTAMNGAPQKKLSTSIASGLRFCLNQLESLSPIELKKTVVLGDGFQNQGSAVPIAQMIHALPGLSLVSVVAVENSDDVLLNQLANNDPALIFKAPSYSDSVRLGELIRDLTLAICGA